MSLSCVIAVETCLHTPFVFNDLYYIKSKKKDLLIFYCSMLIKFLPELKVARTTINSYFIESIKISPQLRALHSTTFFTS